MTTEQPSAYLEKDAPRTDAMEAAIDALYLADEDAVLPALLEQARLDSRARERVRDRAETLVAAVRARKQDQNALEAFMAEYDLSTEEGVVLMCLAEALLRVPDDDTAEKLIASKLSAADWESHLGRSASVLVNASTFGLMLTGRLVRLGRDSRKDFRGALRRLVNRSGEPVVRGAIRQAMRIMGHQYVMGRDIQSALERSRKKRNREYRYSFDMLGEAALTAADAERYLQAYRDAIRVVGAQRGDEDIFAAPSVSVKLSALHPRYEFAQRERVLNELAPKLLSLAMLARERDVALTVDAEEANRLALALELFSGVLDDPGMKGWNGLGLAVQCYQKMSSAVFDYLADLARRSGHRIPVRLVKGAYWDTEIKHAQVEGHPGYPVFTRKANTDVSYIACARKVLADRQAFYPQFATHNAQTIATITELAGDRLDYEFQRLHGMGEDLYGEVLGTTGYNHACRVYAPVGSHQDLLPYLVRRLLENGANTSFVNRLVDERLPIGQVAEDPVEKAAANEAVAHPGIVLPRDLYGASRRNSAGVNLADRAARAQLATAIAEAAARDWVSQPMLGGEASPGNPVFRDCHDPSHPGRVVGRATDASAEDVDRALDIAREFAPTWDATPADDRADALDRAADLFEEHLPEFMALCAREAGKTVNDAVAEVREAVDFLRYYAHGAREQFSQPVQLPGPTGESNALSLHGRGVFACISPWNFPLAIFTGQVSAALAAGNAVIAKPAEQTPLVAARAVELLYQAGIPHAALQYLPGEGAVVGARLTRDDRVDGVAFTGSTETARLINRSLAARESALATLVAETGGQNAMLVDSTALPEQVVKDVIGSAFLSAGQRCSALRVLFLQKDIADHVLDMLAGAMDELSIGDPALLSTDIGPVIDTDALAMLQAHAERMATEGRLVARAPLDPQLQGHFFAPCAFEIDDINRLGREVFGPILHVVRYRARDLDQVVDAINGTGYGLTLGVHSRNEDTQARIASRVRVGNCYINRTMTGAVVGVQPFGGERLSGTGPKAGGPHYLARFATERTLTINTAAVGGNASLLAMEN
ncbi:bifunctional proline dehydrogenase/L-glutamate gamma-semialdehyde dehydrogenase PutA [Marinihelvus fidelis]|uniref:Bifunctional protein PutA n=1 Tax=Marinihelvus fidelis TaxID=2613842 RepID=A0A5N0TA03_9GAMM|nr:bifunctional proline dehydrogenase/L-glutamate gamma-semialdehyde dehydrogenase PutA [Marinihelvus fidelis]KAA9131845.1 bifunctional proline dehydrogenase/L-glutamate gamma-semialdehyde dehydrogenase PutA [Marinihelvus fidelis]